MSRLFRFLFVVLILAALLFAVAFTVLPLPGDVPVLMYHFIGTHEDAQNSKNFVSTEGFEKQMQFLKTFGYRVISMDELYEIKMGKRKPKGKEIVITFDDGNFSFKTLAFPVLERHNFPATVFLVSESMKLQLNGSMKTEDAEELLKKGILILGAHTKTHPFLSETADNQVRDEVIGSKEELEKMFQTPIYYFAYPYGDFDERSMAVAQEAGYRLAFTTSHKKQHGLPETLYSLPRIKMSRSADNPFIMWWKVSGIYDFFKAKLYHLRERSRSY